jgi:hypothetical protein
VSGVTLATAEVVGDPTTVMEVELVTDQLMECKLGGTSVEHPSTIFRRSWQDPLLLSFNQ